MCKDDKKLRKNKLLLCRLVQSGPTADLLMCMCVILILSVIIIIGFPVVGGLRARD